VNTLAKDAGVTSGAFYGYFRSKEDAFIAAVTDGLAEYRGNIKAFQTNYGDDWAVALADYYVSRQHRQDLACGCALPTLSPEVVRADRRVRAAYQSELIKLNETVAAGLAIGTAIENQNTAWVILSLLAGGLTLARAVRDERLAEQISVAIHDATTAIASGKLKSTQLPSPN
jgi:AcrR family transcriptional regulator